MMAWLMTHYLVLGPESAASRRDGMLDYLRRFDAGENPVDAFPKSFGISPEEMQRELVVYVRHATLRGIILPRVPYRGGLSRRIMTDGEDLYRLGDIAVERDAYKAAHDYFDRFQELAADSPFRANVMSRRAIAYVHERRAEEGDALINELLAQNIGDADVLADIAHYAYDRYVREHENADDAAGAHLARSIEYGARAVNANAGDTEALYYLGLAYEADGRLQLAVDTMLRSYDINPSVPRLNMDLVRMLIKGNRPEEASYLVSRLYSASHSEQVRANLLELQQQIEDGEVDPTRLDEFWARPVRR
jgi:tetratricopeptide (TPR) repeat protein